jgi:hypothetical protein
MEKTTTIFHIDGREQTMDIHEASRLIVAGQAGNGKGWSFHKPPPQNWQYEKPRYRVTRDLQPAQKARFRSEPPFSETWQSDVWQYSDRHYEAGEEIESTCWPHPSMRALNYSAERVLAFFISGMKSRLTTSPWNQGRVRLEDGMGGPLPRPITSPNVKPMNLRPVA